MVCHFWREIISHTQMFAFENLSLNHGQMKMNIFYFIDNGEKESVFVTIPMKRAIKEPMLQMRHSKELHKRIRLTQSNSIDIDATAAAASVAGHSTFSFMFRTALWFESDFYVTFKNNKKKKKKKYDERTEKAEWLIFYPISFRNLLIPLRAS